MSDGIEHITNLVKIIIRLSDKQELGSKVIGQLAVPGQTGEKAPMLCFDVAAKLGLTLRRMTDDDLPFAAQLFASTREEELATTGWPIEVRQAFLAQQHQAQHRHFRSHHPDAEWLIVERSGECVGRLYLVEQAKALHVIDISLLPAARGQGLGRALLEDVIAAAEAAGRSVSVQVERHNPALRLYRRLGFALVDDAGAYVCLERRPAD